MVYIKTKKIERPLYVFYSLYVKLDRITYKPTKNLSLNYIEFHIDQDNPSMTENFQFLFSLWIYII